MGLRVSKSGQNVSEMSSKMTQNVTKWGTVAGLARSALDIYIYIYIYIGGWGENA